MGQYGKIEKIADIDDARAVSEHQAQCVEDPTARANLETGHDCKGLWN